jgi:hypothetical protein
VEAFVEAQLVILALARLPLGPPKTVAFYVEQHNTVMPHQAFNGHTPDEIYFGTREDLEQELLERRLQARLERVSRNRELTCGNCAFQASPPSEVTQKAA